MKELMAVPYMRQEEEVPWQIQKEVHLAEGQHNALGGAGNYLTIELDGLSRSSPLAAVPESPADVSALALNGQEDLPFACEVGREGYHEV